MPINQHVMVDPLPPLTLYEGVKQTQHGIEVKIADRSKAIDQIAKILGFYQENVNHSVSEELLAVARAINAASPALTPAASHTRVFAGTGIMQTGLG